MPVAPELGSLVKENQGFEVTLDYRKRLQQSDKNKNYKQQKQLHQIAKRCSWWFLQQVALLS